MIFGDTESGERRVNSYSIDYLDDGKAVQIITAGGLAPADHKHFSLDALDEARRRSCRRFIADHRQAGLDFTFMEGYEWQRQLKQFGLAANMRVAVACAGSDSKAHEFEAAGGEPYNPLGKPFVGIDLVESRLGY